MLKEEVLITFIINYALQTLDVKQVLLKLWSTESFLKYYKMKRLRGSFEDIRNLLDKESLYLLQGFLRCARK